MEVGGRKREPLQGVTAVTLERARAKAVLQR